MRRTLIVTADDFGMCDEVNAGVVLAHAEGIVTSASPMVRRPGAPDAVALARQHPNLALGLHVDLGEWVYVDGAWDELDHVVDADDAPAVSAEIEQQVRRFVALTGTSPTHLDGHQHVQANGAAATALRDLASRLRVPLRLHDERVVYCGSFYGQDGKGAPFVDGVSVEALVDIVRTLPPGCTELGCHPGIGVPRTLTTYAAERELELLALCSDRARAVLLEEGVTLTSFAELAG